MTTWLMAGGAVTPILKNGTSQNVTVGGSSTQSAAVAAGTEYAWLCSTTDCWVARGSNPTAATDASGGSFFLPAKLLLPVQVDGSDKFAVIQDTAAGKLNIVEAS